MVEARDRLNLVNVSDCRSEAFEKTPDGQRFFEKTKHGGYRDPTREDGEFLDRLLPETRRRGHQAVVIPPRSGDGDVAIEAQSLSMKFGDFVAVDQVSFRIQRGETV